jgi:signal peptidase I
MDENQVEEKSDSWLKHELWDLAKVILISAAIVLPVRYFVAQPFIVRGASMESNFHDRDYLIIDEISYYFRNPSRGEAIVFRYPRDPKQYFIKRIVGLPGEKVEIGDGRIRIYNSQYPEGFILDESAYLSPADRSTHPDISRELGENTYFVLGDNRDFSSDSRIWGALDQKFIVGRAIFRAWPVSKFGPIPDYSFVY